MSILSTVNKLWGVAKQRITKAVNDMVNAKPWEQPDVEESAQGAITDYSIDEGRNAIEAHEAGQFAASALIAEHIGRDADVQQAINQRVLALQGMPFDLESADDSDEAKEVAELTRKLWKRICPRRVLSSILRWGVLLGFCVIKVKWRFDERLKIWVPRLKAWHPANIRHDQVENTWYAQTIKGEVEIVEGTGRWIIYRPYSEDRSYMYGAIRCLPEWFLSAQFARRDANRFSEVHGLPVWVPSLPANWQSTPEGEAFVKAFLNIGSEPVIPAPKGTGPENSYSVDLKEAQSTAWAVFEFLMKLAAQKIRLCILGQDMTSSEGTSGSFAKSRVGYDVLMSIVASDAETIGEDLAQLLRPWSQYIAGDAELAPNPIWDYDPPEDSKAVAESMNTAADAVTKWVALLGTSGEPVDVPAMARRFGMLLTAPAPTNNVVAVNNNNNLNNRHFRVRRRRNS